MTTTLNGYQTRSDLIALSAVTAYDHTDLSDEAKSALMSLFDSIGLTQQFGYFAKVHAIDGCYYRTREGGDWFMYVDVTVNHSPYSSARSVLNHDSHEYKIVDARSTGKYMTVSYQINWD